MKNSKPINTPLRHNIGGRCRLLFLVWHGFWFLVLLSILALLWLPFIQLHNRSILAFSGFCATLAALMLVYSLRPRGWTNTNFTPKNSSHISRESFQPLYKILQQLGRSLGVSAPATISITEKNCVAIQATRHWNGKLKSLQVDIGLPLFGTLSEAELSSMITYELGQFFSGSVPLAPFVYRTRLRLINAVTDLDNSIYFLDIFFRSFARLFLTLSHKIAREHVFSADALAAQTFGVIAARAAIEKTHLNGPMWSTYLKHELLPNIDRGARLPIFDGFKRFCKPTAKRAAVQNAIYYEANRSIAEFDGQPSLAERVATMIPGAKPAYPPLADCLHLLGGEVAAENLWYSQFNQQKLSMCSWDNYGEQIFQSSIQQRFEEGWMNPGKLALTELLGLVRESDDLWDKIKPSAVTYLSPQGKRNYTLATLEEWAMACLIDRGFIAKISPGQAIMMERAEQMVNVADLIAAALAGSLKSASLKQYDRLAVQ